MIKSVPAPPCTYTAEQVCQIISVACERPEDSGLPISHWSLSSLAYEVIKRGITIDTDPEAKWIFIADNLNTHQSEGLVKLVAKRLEIHDGFTKKYNIHRLVYYEVHLDVNEAILREKRIKKWNRQWKINLIEQHSPQWLDLSIGLY